MCVCGKSSPIRNFDYWELSNIHTHTAYFATLQTSRGGLLDGILRVNATTVEESVLLMISDNFCVIAVVA